MDFKFSGDWGEENKATATQWIKEKLTELQGEAPEDLFLEYILVMIGNGKSMEEISNELKDFVGEDEARYIYIESFWNLHSILFTSEKI